jgi:RNA polymerase sigma-70 factor, ECF subfamily
MAMSSGKFIDIYDEQISSVFGFLGYRVGRREIAEDLTQTTFEKALRAWGRFDPSRASARTWLLAIARNVLIDHYRRNGAGLEEPIGDDHELAAACGAVPEPEAPGPSPELERALDTLGRRDREVIALRYGGDLNGPEIAELLGLTLANVQQILSRSLRRLRSELENPASLAA